MRATKETLAWLALIAFFGVTSWASVWLVFTLVNVVPWPK